MGWCSGITGTDYHTRSPRRRRYRWIGPLAGLPPPPRTIELPSRGAAGRAAAFIQHVARRLAGRLAKHCDRLFTFLDHPDVPFDNNHAERMIRPAVVLRHNSQSNRSEKGAATQAVLMSVYQTLKLRGHDPLATITEALRTYVLAGTLPPLPPPAAANG